MLLALSIMWGATLAAVLTAIFLRTDREIVRERLSEVMPTPAETARGEGDEESVPPFMDRAIRPLLRWIADHCRRLVRPTDRMGELLRAAGYPLRLNVVEFVGLKVGSAALFLALTVAALLLMVRLRPVAPLLLMAATVIGYLLPSMVLGHLAAERRLQMLLALPDMLDLITLSVEAGMGFDGAVARAVANSSGPLSEEFTHVLSEVGRGMSRADAFRELATRVKIEEISLLVSTVHQSEQLGASIGRALRELGDQLRQERAYRARETIAKLPVKMLFPLLVFIFPALFIVILGPAAIMLKDTRYLAGP